MIHVQKLKKLQTQLNLATQELSAFKIELANKSREYEAKKKNIEFIKAEIEKLNNANTSIVVSEHAIVRYFERVKGFNISEIEKEIISDEIIRWVLQLGGSGTYPNNGYSVVMKDFTIVTIK